MELLGSVTSIPFGSSWPERQPFRIQLAEAPAPGPAPAPPPTWDAQNRILTVHLAQAEQATIRLSSFLGPDDLTLLGIWQWILERNTTQALPLPDLQDTALAVAGAMWLLTPYREIKLVHAVQQPLQPPAFVPGTVHTKREIGSTFANFGATVKVHGKSTARLDLLASWQESVDEPAPGTISVSAHVLDVQIHLSGEAAVTPKAGTQNRVPVAIYDQATDTVQFLAAPPAPPTDLVNPLPNGDSTDGGGVGSSAPICLSRHEFGDTKHRLVTYTVVATSRFREYFPQKITNDPAQLALAGAPAIDVNVLSTARPAAPDVLYVLPMFEWSRAPQDGSLVRVRKGGGVRIYLGRHWFSSGVGELLGVVLAQEDFPPNESLRPFVTQWGNDPIVQSAGVPRVPQLSSFSQGGNPPSRQAIDLSLAELGGGPKVQVAGFPVEFNDERKLWFCDIHVDAGDAYFPFLRLALVRFQPDSLVGLELSHVVQTDFVQLAPERTVIVTPVQGVPDTFAISVEGVTYQANTWSPDSEAQLELDNLRNGPDVKGDIEIDLSLAPRRPPLVEVTVEHRIPGATDEAGWEPTQIAPQVSEAAIAGQPAGPGALLWSGQVSLPAARESGEFRVVIKESEHLRTGDPQFLIAKFQTLGINNKTTLVKEPIAFFPGASRVVFVETVEF